jgi:hypothetical protein
MAMNVRYKGCVLLSFEAWPGTVGTVTHTPDRRPGSVRRSTSIRSTWPDGFEGAFALAAKGRDLVTTEDGGGVVVDEARLDVMAEGSLKAVRSIESDPVVPNLDVLWGANLMGGFRKAVGTNLVLVDGSVLALLLDDLPAAALVSGSARLRAAIEATGELSGFADADLPVVCIGRRPDGVMVQRRREGRPLLGQGPPAGNLDRPDDPLAWPSEAPLPTHGMRRLRRIDVAVIEDEILVDTHFRDSHQESSGFESSVHEYEVLVRAGAGDRIVRKVEVRPRVLPGPDCPAAADSAQAVVGQPLEQLRAFVRAELRDDTICTHLNDQLRSLADVPALVNALQRRPREAG